MISDHIHSLRLLPAHLSMSVIPPYLIFTSSHSIMTHSTQCLYCAFYCIKLLLSLFILIRFSFLFAFIFTSLLSQHSNPHFLPPNTLIHFSFSSIHFSFFYSSLTLNLFNHSCLRNPLLQILPADLSQKTRQSK